MGITSRDIAREAGVSQSTVSRALRGDPRVAPDTLARIRDVAIRLDYSPNLAARSLITRRSDSVAVMVSNIRNPFYPQLLDSLYAEFTSAGFRVVLLHDRAESGIGPDPDLSRGAVDGVVFVSADLTDRLPAKLSDAGLPVVLLNRDVDDIDVDCVTSDNVAGAAQAAEALVTLGHRRIGLISGPGQSSTGRDRDRGFIEGLERAGRKLDDRFRRVSDYSHQDGYQWGMDLLGQSPRPTAIFCANDVVAFGVLDAARRLGLRVPADLSVIGFDDIAMAGWETFGLTTVRQPLDEMAKSAARMLIEQINEPGRNPRRRVFPADLVRRQTTAPPPSV
jgi:LacI family transcriptional regulator